MRVTSRTVFVFDLDDTLYLERDYVRSGFSEIARYLMGHFGWPREHARHFEAGCWAAFCRGVRGTIFNEALERVSSGRSQGLPQPTIAELVACYRQHAPNIQLLPDAIRLLTALHEFRHEIWIITDGPLACQLRKLKALSIDRWTCNWIATDQWGRAFWKPNPRAFRRVESQTRMPGSDCIYFGDNPSKDFLAPNALGWQTIRIRRPKGLHFHEPQGCVDRAFTDLLPVLSHLEAANRDRLRQAG